METTWNINLPYPNDLNDDIDVELEYELWLESSDADD